MTKTDRIEKRLESALDESVEPDSDGDQLAIVEISSTKLSEEDVLEHRWVEDVSSNSMGEYKVSLTVKSE